MRAKHLNEVDVYTRGQTLAKCCSCSLTKGCKFWNCFEVIASRSRRCCTNSRMWQGL